MTIDVVDIDPDIVEVAKKFFGFQEDASMHVYVEDGRRFIEKCKQPYDIIFLDAYGTNQIPYDLATKEFLLATRRATAPNGIVVSNVWSQLSNPLHDAMLRTYQEVFDDLYVVTIKTCENEIFLALPGKTPLDRASWHNARRGSRKTRRSDSTSADTSPTVSSTPTSRTRRCGCCWTRTKNQPRTRTKSKRASGPNRTRPSRIWKSVAWHNN